MAPPIPVNEEIKPTIKPNTVFKNKFNLSFIFASSSERKNLLTMCIKLEQKLRLKT